MSLMNTGLRIIPIEPFENAEANIFGRVIKERGNNVTVSLNKPIQGCDLLELEPINDNKLRQLEQHSTIKAVVYVIDSVLQEKRVLCIANVTTD